MRHDPFLPDTRVPVERFQRSAYRHAVELDVAGSGTETISLMSLRSHRSVAGMFIGCFILLLFLLGRLAQLQITQGNTYRVRSAGNSIRTVTTPAPRGVITDRHGAVLADNTPNLVLTITPAQLPTDVAERSKMLQDISGATGTSLMDITTALASKQRRSTDPITIREHIPYDEAMRDIISTAAMLSVNIISLPNRSYPTANTCANVLGYTGRISSTELEQNPSANPLDIVGKTGLERQYDSTLTGIDGINQVERDVHNQIQRVIAQHDPQTGNTVITTLDLGLQQVLSDQLQSMVSSLKSPGGAAIALNPNNGEVLAMVSAPNYDDNWFVTSGHSAEITSLLQGASQPLLNRAISGKYPSGSLIKPILASAALTEKTITPNTTVNSVGGIKVGNDFFPDWKAGGHGITNVTKALADSVNTFFYAVGGGLDNITGLGVDRIVSYLQKFGWGKKLGIDLPSEVAGLLPTKEWRTTKRASPWKLGDTYHLSIGQGDLEVTPLQIAAALSAVANGGTLYQPHLEMSVKNIDGKTIETKQATILNDHIVPASVLSTVQEGMRQGVLTGTSKSLLTLPVTSAGKTGTAQFGNKGLTHSWYAAYAPYDKPQILIVVLVEAGGEGNFAAQPVAKAGLEWYFTQGDGKSQ